MKIYGVRTSLKRVKKSVVVNTPVVEHASPLIPKLASVILSTLVRVLEYNKVVPPTSFTVWVGVRIYARILSPTLGGNTSPKFRVPLRVCSHKFFALCAPTNFSFFAFATKLGFK